MNLICLHGSLASFGGPYRMDVADVREAVKALSVQLEGFEHAILSGLFRVTQVRRGLELDLDEDTLGLTISEGEIHIRPVLSGSANGQKGKGITKAIAGIALVGLTIITAGAAAPLLAGNFAAAGTAMGAGLFGSAALGALGITYGALATMGVMMAFGGLALALAPSPKGADPNSSDQKNSFLFNGPMNVSEQGHPIQLIYGRCRVGTITISSDLLVNEVGVYTGGGGFEWDSGDPSWPGGRLTLQDIADRAVSA